MTKICCKCKKEKDVGEFHKCGIAKDGVQSRCKECRAGVAQEYGKRQEVKERSKESARRYRLKMTVIEKEIPEKKVCPECKELKKGSEFHKNNGSRDGLREICKKCSSNYQQENKEAHNRANRGYRSRNKEKIKAKTKEYQSRPEVRQHRSKCGTKYYQENIEHYKEWRLEYCSKPETKEYKRNYVRTKRQMDVSYRLHGNFSSLMKISLKKKNINKNYNRTFDLVGYTVEQLKEHLEKLWEPWMNWDNYGKYRVGGEKRWQIDHIKPRSSFKIVSLCDEEFRKCWALENLRPLEAVENMRKGDRLQ
jgi:hypothetical protein